MPNPNQPQGVSPEVSTRIAQEELLAIDWRVQAEGCALMYERTGDTDYELMRIEAEERAAQQETLFSQIQALEQLL